MKPVPSPPDQAEQIKRIEAVLNAMALVPRRRPLALGWRQTRRAA